MVWPTFGSRTAKEQNRTIKRCFIFPTHLNSVSAITACTVVQAVVKATSQSNGKGQILTPWGSETPEQISMKLWNI